MSILLSLTALSYFYYSLAAVSVIGFFASFLFYMAISSGITYMQKRKLAMVDIEKIFIKLDGTRIVSAGYDKKDLKFRKSPTTTSMIMMPKVFSIIWGIVFLFSVTKMVL